MPVFTRVGEGRAVGELKGGRCVARRDKGAAEANFQGRRQDRSGCEAPKREVGTGTASPWQQPAMSPRGTRDATRFGVSQRHAVLIGALIGYRSALHCSAGHRPRSVRFLSDQSAPSSGGDMFSGGALERCRSSRWGDALYSASIIIQMMSMVADADGIARRRVGRRPRSEAYFTLVLARSVVRGAVRCRARMVLAGVHVLFTALCR